jgi:hypothetical protein
MQLFRPLLAQQLDRAHANVQMLIHPFAIELIRHAGSRLGKRRLEAVRLRAMKL